MKKSVLPRERQFTASILLVADSGQKKVLLIHHKKLGVWLQPGGHVEPFETLVEAAVRECREETGIDIAHLLSPGKKVDEYAYPMPVPQFILEERIPPHGNQPEHFHIDCIYVVRLPEQAAHHQAKEAHDIGWFSLEDALKLKTFANTQWLLRQVLS